MCVFFPAFLHLPSPFHLPLPSFTLLKTEDNYSQPSNHHIHPRIVVKTEEENMSVSVRKASVKNERLNNGKQKKNTCTIHYSM
uniref:Uncharacterized protein n=1 Tax=Caenorhabditis japonica TaxID=281687 RepID=A0A8R1E668_CAEJA